LAGSAKRDIDAMLGKMHKHADKDCIKAYKAASEKILNKTNADFDKSLKEILTKVKK
jgi:hypothetical protein